MLYGQDPSVGTSFKSHAFDIWPTLAYNSGISAVKLFVTLPSS